MELTNGEEPFKLTEAFDGVNTANAVLSLLGDGTPRLYVETVADGQAAWTYDIFFVGPHLANVPELVIIDEGTGTHSHGYSKSEVVQNGVGRTQNSDWIVWGSTF